MNFGVVQKVLAGILFIRALSCKRETLILNLLGDYSQESKAQYDVHKASEVDCDKGATGK